MAKTPISVRLDRILKHESNPVLVYDLRDKFCFFADNPETAQSVLVANGETLDEAIGNYFKAVGPKNRNRTKRVAPTADESTDND